MTLHRHKLSKVRKQAEKRPPGYYEDVVSRGEVDGDELVISSEALATLREKYSGPTLTELLTNFTGAMLRWGKAGFPILPQDKIRARLDVCQSCEHWTGSKCGKCGCRQFKLWMATERCPLGKWEKG